MTGKGFVDTNILLYARDSSEPLKQEKAETLLRGLWAQRTGRISVQVLNEYFVYATAKLDPGLSREEAWEDVEALKAWQPVPIDMELLSTGYRLQCDYGLSWWDSLIVAAAEVSGCDHIFTEDLSADQSYHGIRVINPFAD